jgi:hypothetical protein
MLRGLDIVVVELLLFDPVLEGGAISLWLCDAALLPRIFHSSKAFPRSRCVHMWSYLSSSI